MKFQIFDKNAELTSVFSVALYGTFDVFFVLVFKESRDLCVKFDLNFISHIFFDFTLFYLKTKVQHKWMCHFLSNIHSKDKSQVEISSI